MIDHRAAAAEHAAKAEELLAKSEKGSGSWKRTAAPEFVVAHATLALYHQREADREESRP